MGTSRGKYLIKNIVIFALGNFGTKFIGFFLVPLYTNVLTTSEYGITDMISTIGMILVPFLTLNICEAVMRFALDVNADYNKIMSIGICALMIAGGAGICVIPFCKILDNMYHYSIYVYFYTVSLAFSQMFSCYLRGKELLLKYSIGNILQSLCIAFLNIIFLVKLNMGIEGYLMAYILANFITAIYAFVVGKVWNVIKNFSIDKRLCKEMIIYAVVLIPNTFMWWIMNSSDRLMVTAMVGATANGIYAIAYKVPTLLSTVTQVFNQAWSYSAIREEKSMDAEKYNNDIYNRLVVIACVCASGLMMIMKVFLKYYVGAEYYEAWRYTPVLIMGFVFSTLGSFVATSYTVHKDSFGFFVSGTVGAVINIVLNFLLIPSYGVMGAAIATAISYFVVFVCRVQNTRKYLKLYILKRCHIIGYMILLVQAITMFIEKEVGQVLLVFEFIAIIFAFWGYIKQFMIDIRHLVFKK